MDWSTIFDSTWVSNFWAGFNKTINDWIGFTPGWTQTQGALTPFFMFLIALAILGMILRMIHQITSDPGIVEDNSGESSHGNSFRDA
jgi:hypothetical protein